MTDPKPYDTSRYGKLYADAQRQEELLAPLTEDQRARVRRLRRETSWNLERCVRFVLREEAYPALTDPGLDRLYEAMIAQSEAKGIRVLQELGDGIRLENAEAGYPRPPWPQRVLQRAYSKVCSAYARVLLRDPSFTLDELRDLYGQADEELPPHLAHQAQRLIEAEISRRTRKDY